MQGVTLLAVAALALLGNTQAYHYYILEDDTADTGAYYEGELSRVRRQSEGSVTGGVNASPGGGATVNLGANKLWNDGATGVGGTYKGTFGEGKPQHDLGLTAGHKWSGGQASLTGNVPLGSNAGPATLGGKVGGTVWSQGASSLDLNAGYAGQIGQGRPQHALNLGASHISPGSKLDLTGSYSPTSRQGGAAVDYSRQIWKGPRGQSFDVTGSYTGQYGGGRPNHGAMFGGRLNF